MRSDGYIEALMFSDQMLHALHPIAARRTRRELQRRYYYSEASCQARADLNALTKSIGGCVVLGVGMITIFLLIGLIMVHVSPVVGLGLFLAFTSWYFFKTIPTTLKKPESISLGREISKQAKVSRSPTTTWREYPLYRPPRLLAC